jgi:hypothetical protein
MGRARKQRPDRGDGRIRPAEVALAPIARSQRALHVAGSLNDGSERAALVLARLQRLGVVRPPIRFEVSRIHVDDHLAGLHEVALLDH